DVVPFDTRHVGGDEPVGRRRDQVHVELDVGHVLAGGVLDLHNERVRIETGRRPAVRVNLIQWRVGGDDDLLAGRRGYLAGAEPSPGQPSPGQPSGEQRGGQAGQRAAVEAAPEPEERDGERTGNDRPGDVDRPGR